jgi:uncharacterized protein
MFYLDTSLLVSSFSNEPRSAIVDEWMSRQDKNELCISDWVITEVSSALSIKIRRGTINEMQRGAILAEFTRLTADTFTVLPVAASALRTAARFCDQSQLKLRSADALHLAICAEHGATIYTLDQVLSRAALALGVASILL